MPAQLKGTETLGAVYGRGFPLGVICRICDHRALIPCTDIGARRGDVRLLTELKLKCTRCGSDRWSPILFDVVEEVRAFRATLPPVVDKNPPPW
jgi:hypothetical protein